ncbi:MAG TPA: nodulation protein NfeD [Actinomycetota bacterium]|nr:nodulation protein NfeD [Actinomycetota bacterium]
MNKIALGLIALALAFGPVLPAAAQQEHVVVIVEVRGVIDPTTAGYLTETIDDAIESEAEAVIIQLDTPGGLDVSMREMVQKILRSPVPVVLWVGPPGARAASAGVFLVYASHVAAMASGTNLGAAHPVDLGGDLSGAVEEKAVNDATAFLRSLAEQRGRDVEFAEEAVRESASLTATEAKGRGVIEILAPTIGNLLRQLDGVTVTTDAGERTLRTNIDEDQVVLRFHKLGLLRRILHAVTDPTIAYLLLILGFWAIVFELSQPGFGIAGVAGAVSLILAFYALAVLPVNLAALLLVLLGLALFTVDVFTAGLGVFTVGGTLALTFGSFLLFAGSPAIDVSPWVIAVVVASSVLFFGFAMTVAMRARRRQAITGQEGMIGLVGVSRAELSPEGQVLLKGALWKARAVDGPIGKGRPVRVRRIDGLTLFVEEEKKGEEK